MINAFKTLLNGLMEYVKSMKSDWNENDPTNPHYVKNRTHWKEEVAVEEVSETNVIFDGAGCEVESPFEFIPEKGSTYTVIFDGVRYECIGKYNSAIDALYVGNPTIAHIPGEDVDTGEAFLILYSSNTLLYSNSSGTHTFKILGTNTVYHPFNINYLPRIEDAIENATDTTKGLCPPLRELYDDISGKLIREYHTESNILASTRTDVKNALNKSSNHNLPIGIFNSTKKMSGKILNGYNDIQSSKTKVILSGNDRISYWEISDSTFKKIWEISAEGIMIKSSTEGSIKEFRITVDDTGTLSATEVTS